jgi:transcriptional regulator with XRE-family HTH domain
LKARNSKAHRAMCAVLLEARESAGISSREVSRRLRRPENFAHRVESGERMLSAPELIEYARALDADPVELFTRIVKRS